MTRIEVEVRLDMSRDGVRRLVEAGELNLVRLAARPKYHRAVVEACRERLEE